MCARAPAARRSVTILILFTLHSQCQWQFLCGGAQPVCIGVCGDSAAVLHGADVAKGSGPARHGLNGHDLDARNSRDLSHHTVVSVACDASQMNLNFDTRRGAAYPFFDRSRARDVFGRFGIRATGTASTEKSEESF